MPTQRKSQAIASDPSRCAGCLTCELRCSFHFTKTFNPSLARIRIRRLAGQAEEYEISFTPECNHCGTCARYCPYGALTQEKKGKG